MSKTDQKRRMIFGNFNRDYLSSEAKLKETVKIRERRVTDFMAVIGIFLSP